MISKIKIDKEFISYGVVGVITTLLHILLFYILSKIISYKIANIITLICIKTLAYLFNKKYVFHTKCRNHRQLVGEIIKYIISRLFTMVIDYIGLIILVEVCHLNHLVGKIIVLVIVTIINYFFCKKYVFQ